MFYFRVKIEACDLLQEFDTRFMMLPKDGQSGKKIDVLFCCIMLLSMPMLHFPPIPPLIVTFCSILMLLLDLTT